MTRPGRRWRVVGERAPDGKRVAQVGAEDADEPAEDGEQDLGCVLAECRGRVVPAGDVDDQGHPDQEPQDENANGEDDGDEVGGAVAAHASRASRPSTWA